MRAVVSCAGCNIVSRLADLAAYEMVNRKIADKKVCTGKLVRYQNKIPDLFKRYDEIIILEACSSLCVSNNLSELLPDKKKRTICLPKQGFSKDNIKDINQSLEQLMEKIAYYFEKTTE